ncbi:hypothetical protein [Streptomyces sp. BH105]|uniref:hypothetical protein n=1 Tax=Streptomyces sp. BH105 TaxID=3410408 RepID=UPI003CF5F3F5
MQFIVQVRVRTAPKDGWESSGRDMPTFRIDTLDCTLSSPEDAEAFVKRVVDPYGLYEHISVSAAVPAEMLSKQSQALVWVAEYVATRNFNPFDDVLCEIKGRFRGFGKCEQSALDDAISSGRTSPVTLDNVKHGCMTEFHSTPFGVVMLDQG